jgi:hypothetical protein
MIYSNIRHFMDNFQTGTLAIFFTSLRVRINNLIMELADSLLQPTMALKTQKINGSECGHNGARKATLSIPPCNKGYSTPPLAKWVRHTVLC